MSDTASLLVPVLRWDASHGFTHLRDAIDDAIDLGVGGFLIHGGPRETVSTLAADLHHRSKLPLLLAADVERGAGQQFDGCIGLPPLAALGFINDPDSIRRAARITARELKHLGLNWALAPVCDLDTDPGSAIVGTRAIGSDPAIAASLLTEWVDACQAEGVLACAKHFPGHGQAADDSHRTLPTVHARAAQLRHDDLLPFRAVLDAGVASIMTAHVAYPSLDATGVPATLSAPILTGLLRDEMEFGGLIVSDALEMDGLLAAGTETEGAVHAVAAGCDLLLAPMDIAAVAAALEQAVQRGTLASDRVHDAMSRRSQWALWGKPAEARETTMDDMMWARQAADRSITLLRGRIPTIGSAVEVVIVDEDAAGPWHAPSRGHFPALLRKLELDAPVVDQPTTNTRVPVLIAAYADVVAWKGDARFAEHSVQQIDRTLALAHAQRRDSLIVLFSHPRHAAQFPSATNILCAWGGEQPMQEAAARAVVRT